MSKITLDPLAGTFAAVTALNEKFQAIEDAFNDRVLYRDNIDGEPNHMQNDLDMNSQRILNLPSPISNSEPARWIDVLNGVSTTDTILPSVVGNEDKFLSSNGSAVVYKKGTIRYATVADMTADTSTVLGQVVSCDDYASGRGAGVLTFKVVAAATGTVDGGSYLDHDTLSLQFERIFNTTVSPKEFGAVANGVADDTTKVQATLDSGEPDIVIDGNVKVSSVSIPSTVRSISGTGTVTQSAVSNICFTASSLTGKLSIHGLTFIGAATAGTVSLSTDSAMQFTSCESVKVYDCTFKNFSYNTVYLIDCNRCHVFSNDFENVAHSVRFRGCINSTMEGNIQEGTILADTALAIPFGLDSTNGHAYGICKRCTIKNNIAIDIPYGEGVLVHAGQRIVIEGNVFENLHFGIGLNPFNATDTLEDVTISNNSLYGTNSTDWTTATGSDPDEGIFVGGSAVTTRPSNIIITGNNIAHYNYVVDNTNQGGIVVRYSRGVSITGNTISDCKGNGIALNDDTDGISIVGNTIDNIAFNGAATLKNGIFMNHASSEALIDGNIFSNITGANSQAIRGDAGSFLLGTNQFLNVDNPVGDFGATIRDKSAISVTSGSAVDLDGVEVVEFDASGGAISILAGSGMFTNIIQGRIYVMTNVGSTNNVTIQRHATYCQTVGAANITLTPGDSAMFIGGSTTGTIRQATPVAAVS